jgi:hypothetical protein
MRCIVSGILQPETAAGVRPAAVLSIRNCWAAPCRAYPVSISLMLARMRSNRDMRSDATM